MDESKGGKCLSLIYINSLTPMKWYCDICEYEWKITFHNIKNHNQWCSECTRGKNERECKEIIERYFPKRRPKFLKGLELDGFNKESKLVFEYNGMQHYKYIPFFHRNGIQDFYDQQERDKNKLELCIKMVSY